MQTDENKLIMNKNVIKFKAQKTEYPMAIIDIDGHKWITAQQVGEAMGSKNYRKLIQHLKNNNEIQEDKHYRVFNTRKTSRGNPNVLILSYRGIIRFAMRSQGQRARLFRDFAEDVLHEVLMTGRYEEGIKDVGLARIDGIRCGLMLSTQLSQFGFDMDDVAQLSWYRRKGLTQRESAKLMGMTREKIQQAERLLKTIDISFEPVVANKRKKKMVKSLDQALMIN